MGEISSILRNTPQAKPSFIAKNDKIKVVRVMHRRRLVALNSVTATLRIRHWDGDELMKILLAVDGSDCSDAAVEEIARRPWPEGSFIKVLTTYELPTPPSPQGWALPLNYFEGMDIALRKQAENSVNSAIEKLNHQPGRL